MLERTGSDWKVYDIAIEDVSMVENYRAQFDRVIRSRGMPQLLAALRAKQALHAASLGTSGTAHTGQAASGTTP